MNTNNTSKNSPPTVTAIVLAGGAGRRVGGVDKGLVDYRGRRAIDWVITAIQSQVTDVIISINRNQQDYQPLGLPLVFDAPDEPAYQGPLAGVMAALNASKLNENTYYLLCTCDSPNLPSDYVDKLASELTAKQAQVAIVHDGERRQNLHCLIRDSAIPSLQSFYADGGRAIHSWFDQVDCVDVDLSEQAERFINLNTLSH